MFEDRSRGVGGRLGDNVDVARAPALVHVHTARALFFIILTTYYTHSYFKLITYTFNDIVDCTYIVYIILYRLLQLHTKAI